MNNKCPFTGLPCNNPKPIQIYQNVDLSKKEEYKICPECLSMVKTQFAQTGTENPLKEVIKIITGTFQPVLFDFKDKDGCPNCGLTGADFLKNGKLGCSVCYEHFGDSMKDFIAMNQAGNKHHKGKAKKQTKQEKILELKKLMDRASAAEKYEEAAKYRDEIKSLEQS